jgi:phosphomannomutase
VKSDIFKPYDIRGLVGSELNADVAKTIGRAFAAWLVDARPVAVGRDMRTDSRELADALISGLRQQGRDVIDIGEVTSDMIYFAVGHYKLGGGAMITASHNPGAYNGIKLCREEAKPIGEESGLYEIRDMAMKNKFKSAATQGALTSQDITEDWIQHVLTFIDPSKIKPLHIAVDAGNGMAGKIFTELEPYVPFDVEELYFEPDGTFPNHIANPIEPKNLVDVQKLIKATHCDAGLAFDGDGDRAVVLDELGAPLTGSILTALLAEYFLKKYPGATILYNAICGQIVPETIARYGGRPIRTRVGHSFIKAAMRTNQAVFAGELSGHYYFADNFMADSGLIAAMIALSILSQSGKPLSKLVAPLRAAYVQNVETNFTVADKTALLHSIAKVYAKNDQDWLDGLTVQMPHEGGWFNVRASGTEPLLRFNAEAKSSEGLEHIVRDVTKLIVS